METLIHVETDAATREVLDRLSRSLTNDLGPRIASELGKSVSKTVADNLSAIVPGVSEALAPVSMRIEAQAKSLSVIADALKSLDTAIKGTRAELAEVKASAALLADSTAKESALSAQTRLLDAMMQKQISHEQSLQKCLAAIGAVAREFAPIAEVQQQQGTTLLKLAAGVNHITDGLRQQQSAITRIGLPWYRKLWGGRP